MASPHPPNQVRAVTPCPPSPKHGSKEASSNGSKVSAQSTMTKKSTESKNSKMEKKKKKKDKKNSSGKALTEQQKALLSAAEDSTATSGGGSSCQSQMSSPLKKESFFQKLKRKSKRTKNKKGSTMSINQDDSNTSGNNSDVKVVDDPELEHTTFERVAVKGARPAVVEDLNAPKIHRSAHGSNPSPQKPHVAPKAHSAPMTGVTQQKAVWMKK